MFILDFNRTASQAFAHGFLKGLAAPVMLYHVEPSPTIKLVEFVMYPTLPTDRVLAGDWHRIGVDLNSVIEREYGTKTDKFSRKKVRRKRR